MDIVTQQSRKRAPRMTYSQDLQHKIDQLVETVNEIKINVAEVRITTISRLELVEKRQDAMERRQDAMELAEKAKPDRAWSRAGTLAMIAGIAVSNAIAIIGLVVTLAH